MSDKRIVFTTAGTAEEATKIGQHLVEARLAACVNIIPGIVSIYRWKEKVEEDNEFLLIIKTTSDAFEKVCLAIKELHSYELPECICVNIEKGSPDYLRWISDSMAAPDPGD